MDPVEVLVGIVGRPHGVRGEVIVQLRTDEPARRFRTGQPLRTEDGLRTLIVTSSREANGRFLVSFADVSDRGRAEALRGARLVVDVDGAESPPAPGEFYDRQLVGLTVVDADGVARGLVTAVVHLPAQDLLEIAVADQTRLVPFVAALVPGVDLAAGRVQLAEVADGLLSDDPAE